MNRSRDLFWKLIESEHAGAQTFCRKLVRNREDGDDLYQDCLVVALNQFEQLREIDAFRPWLYRIMINRFKNSVRRPWWKAFVPLTREIEEATEQGDPASRLRTKRTLALALNAVTSDERVLVTLFELEGWSLAELSELKGISEGAVKARLFRARRKMRKALIRAASQAGRKKNTEPLMSEDEVCVAAKLGGD